MGAGTTVTPGWRWATTLPPLTTWFGTSQTAPYSDPSAPVEPTTVGPQAGTEAP